MCFVLNKQTFMLPNNTYASPLRITSLHTLIVLILPKLGPTYRKVSSKPHFVPRGLLTKVELMAQIHVGVIHQFFFFKKNLFFLKQTMSRYIWAYTLFIHTSPSSKLIVHIAMDLSLIFKLFYVKDNIEIHLHLTLLTKTQGIHLHLRTPILRISA